MLKEDWIMNNCMTHRLVTHCLILISATLYSSAGLSGLVGDSQWQVEKGDSVYSIARKVFPDDANKQRQFRSELVIANPEVFHGNANQLGLGARLTLPGLAVSQPEKVAPVDVPEAVVEVETVSPVITEEKEVTVDPEDVIGRVVISRGDMQATNRGSFRKLLRHSNIMKGDTLVTSARSYTQIRMKDGALISLRPNTELVITDYNFNGQEDGTERGFFELVRGGFRTITGYIGHRNKHNYRVKTAVATIGIRGTHYGLMVCESGSCNEESPDLKDGVYGGVVDGSIIVNNDAGESVFNNDQYFHVASQSQPAVEQLIPPPVFHGNSEKPVKLAKSGELTKATNGKSVNQKNVRGNALGSLVFDRVNNPEFLRAPIFADQRKNQINDIVAITEEVSAEDIIPGLTNNFAPDGSAMLIALSDVDTVTGELLTGAAQIRVGPGSNDTIRFGEITNAAGVSIKNIPLVVHEESEGIHELVLPSGVDGVSNIGGNAIGVNWGRWSSDYLLTEDGKVVKTFGQLHYIYSDNITSPTRIAQLGGILSSSEFYSHQGGTTPTSATGQVGTLSSLTITADFLSSSSINYQLTGANGGKSFVVGATVPFTQMSEFNLVDMGCTNSCEGNASAAFIGNNADGIITTYSVKEVGGTNGINGAAVLTR